MAKHSTNEDWRTVHELAFIDGLGTWGSDKFPTIDAVIDLTAGYLEGCKLREKWDDIDAFAAVEHAKLKLQNLISRKRATLKENLDEF